MQISPTLKPFTKPFFMWICWNFEYSICFNKLFTLSISFIVHVNRSGEPRTQARLLINLETTRFKLIWARKRKEKSCNALNFTFRWPFNENFILFLFGWEQKKSFMKTDIVARKYRIFFMLCWLYPSNVYMKNSRSIKKLQNLLFPRTTRRSLCEMWFVKNGWNLMNFH